MCVIRNSGKINEVDVLVKGIDIFDQNECRLGHNLASQPSCHLSRVGCGVQLKPQTRFLLDFADGRIIGQLVALDVPARRQPELLLWVQMKKHTISVHDERRCGKVSGNLSQGEPSRYFSEPTHAPQRVQ